MHRALGGGGVPEECRGQCPTAMAFPCRWVLKQVPGAQKNTLGVRRAGRHNKRSPSASRFYGPTPSVMKAAGLCGHTRMGACWFERGRQCTAKAGQGGGADCESHRPPGGGHWHAPGHAGFNWSGVDPPLSSSRACLTTFIANSVP